MSGVRLSVVMPVYNEASVLSSVLDDIATHVLDAVPDSELVVVDDNSSDRSPQLLAETHANDPRVRILTNVTNRGHGPSVRRGIDESTGEWILHLDSDGQFDLTDFARLWALADDNDLVLGVRSERNDPFHRLVLTRATRALASALARHRVRDANTPFRLVRRTLFDHLRPAIPPDTFAPAIAVVIGAYRSGARVTDVEVTHLARPHGQSTLRVGRLARVATTSAFQTISFATRRLPRYEVRSRSTEG
jgi:glycosyltransferase involved in cell wall biosynthesis